MPTFYGNMRGTSGVPNTKALNRVETFPATPVHVADQNFTISGITKDSTGAVLGSVTVELFDATTEAFLSRTVSDSITGVYKFFVRPLDPHQCTAYKVGAPDVAGITLNTLVGV